MREEESRSLSKDSYGLAMSSSDPTHARSNSSTSTLADATHPMPETGNTTNGPAPSSLPSTAHGQKAWMESDKEQAELPYNNFYLVMPALMLVLFLAALDQTIVCE